MIKLKNLQNFARKRTVEIAIGSILTIVFINLIAGRSDSKKELESEFIKEREKEVSVYKPDDEQVSQWKLIAEKLNKLEEQNKTLNTKLNKIKEEQKAQIEIDTVQIKQAAVKKEVTQTQKKTVSNRKTKRIIRKKRDYRFDVSFKENTTTLKIPKGTRVPATLLTGVESKENGREPVLLALDGNFYLPNNYKMNMVGCALLGKAEGNMSNERVCIQVYSLACVSRAGEVFETSVNGFIADDKDNAHCAIGKVNSKADSHAYKSAIAEMISMAGDFIKQGAITSTTTPLGGVTTTISTGQRMKEVAAAGGSAGAKSIADWYMRKADKLMPTINVGSGRRVWVVNLKTIEIPETYFVKEKLYESVDDHLVF